MKEGIFIKSIEFAERIKQALELYKQLVDIEDGLEKLRDTPVIVKQDGEKRHGYILFINTETGIVTVDFGLKSTTDYGVGLYHYNDFLSKKIVFAEND